MCCQVTFVITLLQWSEKLKKQRRKQWEDFLTFLITDLESEVEYQYEVKDSEGKVIAKGKLVIFTLHFAK